MYQWMYATPLSGLSFPLITASGTLAAGYNTSYVSGTISLNGGAWQSIGARISGIPGDGIYTIAALSSTEMTCYSWLIKITANSGCLPQVILGYNLSGYATAVNVSALSNITGLDYSGIASQTWNSLKATYTSTATFADLQNTAGANTSAIAAQVWNSLLATYTSTTTFGGNQSGLAHTIDTSGNNAILVAISAIPLAVASGWNWTACSGNDKILVAVSGLKNDVSGLPGILTAVSAPKILASAYHSGATVMGVANAMSGNAGTATVDISGIAAQVWNSLLTTYTSATTFGGNQSGLAHAVDTSGNNAILVAVSAIPLAIASGWNWTACSGNDKILQAVSGLKNDVSGLPGMLVAISAPKILASAYHSGATVMGVANAMSGNAGTATVDISSIAAQVWNSLLATYTSTATFGNLQNTAGASTSGIAAQVWNSLRATYTSTATFGAGILQAISGLRTDVSALSNITGLDYSGIAAQTWNSLKATYTSTYTFADLQNTVGANTSAIAAQVWNSVRTTYTSGTTFGGDVNVSGQQAILAAVSGLRNDVSALANIGNFDYSGVASQVWNSLEATYTSTTTFGNLQNTGGSVNLSAIAAQVWNSLEATYTSTATFGNLQNSAGASTSAIAAQVWNSLIATYTSGTTYGGTVVLSGRGIAWVNVSMIAGQVWNSLLATYTSTETFADLQNGAPATVDVSSIAGQVWNSLLATYTSTTTFGGNLSGLAHSVDCSGNNAILTAVSAIPLAVASGWNWTLCSGNDKILQAVSGLKNDVSGLPGMLTAISAPKILASAYHSGATVMGVANAMSGNAGTASVDISSIAAQVWNSLEATYTSAATFGNLQNTAGASTSAIAAQVWNSVLATYTSATTFGGGVLTSGETSGMYATVSGLGGILTAVSAIPLAVASGWNWTACSGNDKILSAVSGLKNDVSGLPGILTAVSAPKILASAYHSGATVMAVANAMSGNAGTASVDISGIAAQVWNSLLATYTSTATFGNLQNTGGSVNLSAIAGQVWNSLQLSYTSGTTFGGMVNISGLTPILAAISGLTNNVSGLTGILNAVSGVVNSVASGFAPILVAVSGMPDGVLVAGISDAASLTSGTVGHTLRLLRWYSWDNLYIDKTFNPVRLYLKTNATNYSSYWEINDTSSLTSRVRGG